MATEAGSGQAGWRSVLPASVRPYTEPAPLAALFLGISSGFPYAMIGATLTTRLKQNGIDKSTITAFTLVFLAYNFKFLWAWIVDGVRLPVLGRLGQRVSWMLVTGVPVIAAVINLALVDPAASIGSVVTAAVLVGIAGASFDIVIDAYRIEILEPRQLGVGSGMSQYGWRIGSAGAGALALVVAARGRVGSGLPRLCRAGPASNAHRAGHTASPSVIATRPRKRVSRGQSTPSGEPFVEFFQRQGALLVLLFILVHKIGDTLANLTFRLLFDDLRFTNDEIALYDVGVGFWAYLIGIFIGGILYAQLGMKRSVLVSLVLMAVSNFSFALLAVSGHSNLGMAGAIGFENFASGIGGVTVVAYFSALWDLRFTASQYALISAAASIVGRFLTGTSAGALIDCVWLCQFLPADDRRGGSGNCPLLVDDARRAGRPFDRVPRAPPAAATCAPTIRTRS